MYTCSTVEKRRFCQSMTTILIIIVFLPGVSAIVCKGDQYFDPNTGNCDPCAPLCAVSDCSSTCPNYHLPRESSVFQPALSDNSSTFRREYIVIIIAIASALAFFALFALFGYILHKRRQERNSQIPVTTVAVQIDDPDIENEEAVSIYTNTEHV
ncbi:hypothetical protein ACJMK2_039864 [Sinanodonta woodiana]|uniref:Uncharacterized protein n=1 Tax=Sinanodonta woodiana TaxID=1069815 RepID=A0ABD3WDA0_SINWO